MSLQVFFDGDCPLCSREIAMLKRWDRTRRICFVDIAAPGFSATEYGRSHQEFMARLHGRMPSGEWTTGVETFRQIYSRLGFGLLVKLTRLPPLSLLLEALYRIFAANRLRWTSRCEQTCAIPK